MTLYAVFKVPSIHLTTSLPCVFIVQRSYKNGKPVHVCMMCKVCFSSCSLKTLVMDRGCLVCFLLQSLAWRSYFMELSHQLVCLPYMLRRFLSSPFSLIKPVLYFYRKSSVTQLLIPTLTGNWYQHVWLPVFLSMTWTMALVCNVIYWKMKRWSNKCFRAKWPVFM